MPSPPTAQPAAADGPQGIRISKLITERGLASRREADEWIEAGWVRVDGRLAVLGQRAATDARIDIDPKARNEQARRVTILLNKPIGYVSGQAEDGYAPAVTLVTAHSRWVGDKLPRRFHPGQVRGAASSMRRAARAVRLPLRVCSIHSLPSCTVNSMSCMSR